MIIGAGAQVNARNNGGKHLWTLPSSTAMGAWLKCSGQPGASRGAMFPEEAEEKPHSRKSGNLSIKP